MADFDLAYLGFIAVVIGVVLIFASSLTSKKSHVEGGGVVFIGPIPIVGATSERALFAVLAITVVFLLMFVEFSFLR